MPLKTADSWKQTKIVSFACQSLEDDFYLPWFLNLRHALRNPPKALINFVTRRTSKVQSETSKIKVISVSSKVTANQDKTTSFHAVWWNALTIQVMGTSPL